MSHGPTCPGNCPNHSSGTASIALPTRHHNAPLARTLGRVGTESARMLLQWMRAEAGESPSLDLGDELVVRQSN